MSVSTNNYDDVLKMELARMICATGTLDNCVRMRGDTRAYKAREFYVEGTLYRSRDCANMGSGVFRDKKIIVIALVPASSDACVEVSLPVVAVSDVLTTVSRVQELLEEDLAKDKLAKRIGETGAWRRGVRGKKGTVYQAREIYVGGHWYSTKDLSDDRDFKGQQVTVMSLTVVAPGSLGDDAIDPVFDPPPPNCDDDFFEPGSAGGVSDSHDETNQSVASEASPPLDEELPDETENLGCVARVGHVVRRILSNIGMWCSEQWGHIVNIVKMRNGTVMPTEAEKWNPKQQHVVHIIDRLARVFKVYSIINDTALEQGLNAVGEPA